MANQQTTSDGRRDRNSYDNPPPAATPTPKPKLPKNTVRLIIAGQEFTGWLTVRIGRGLERFPGYFILTVTEKLPGSPKAVSVMPGSTCKIQLDDDVILTGYIDRYEAEISSREHRITIIGRSATEDLVDCAAGVSPGKERVGSGTGAGMTFSCATILQLAKDLCAPFGITATAPDGEGDPLVSIGDGIPQWTIPLGATVYDVLEPLAQWRRLILMDGTDGNLILGKVGTAMASSPISLPGIMIEGAVAFDVQRRYSVYLPALQAFDQTFEAASAAGVQSANSMGFVQDTAAFAGRPRFDGQARYRPHFVLNEAHIGSIFLAESQANWQRARDFGRSQALKVRVSLWRNADGNLWKPNTLVQLDAPLLKLSRLIWLISDVTFIRSVEAGTVTELQLMPPEAFQPEPSLLTPFDPEIQQALPDQLNANPRPSQAGPTGAK